MSARRGKLAARIARELEAEIMESGWPIGRSLGSETALIERFGVSRAVMREAIRIVESHGVAQMRLGPGGGLTVTAPSSEVVLEQVSLLLDHAEVTARDIFEARNAVELTCVRLATERIDEERIGELRAVLVEERARTDAAAHSSALHLAIADAAGNPALRLLVEILDRLMTQHMPVAPSSSESVEENHAAHAAIVAAIVAGDGPLAQHRLRRHLATTLSAHIPQGAVMRAAPATD